MKSHNDVPFLAECAPAVDVPLLVAVRKAAQMLGVREGTMRKWIAGDRIRSVKLSNARRIPMTEVLRLSMEGMPLNWAN